MIVTLILGYFNFINAQESISLPVSLVSDAEGLLEKDNRFLYFDSYGYAWISSVYGLYRYDGKVIKRYLPIDGDSTSIRGLIINGQFFEDQEKNIWFTTYDAINCYRRNHDHFDAHAIPGKKEPGYFSGGLDSLNQLWFIFDTLLMTFNIIEHQFKTITSIRPGSTRLKIALNHSGQIQRAYIYNTERSMPGLEIIDFQKQVPQISRVYYSITEDYPLVVRNVYPENDTSVWIASHYGLIHMHPQTGDTIMYSPETKSKQMYFNYVDRYNDSLLIVSSYGKGLFTFNINTKKFGERFHLMLNEQAILGPLQTVYRDAKGGIWISITGTGIAYFQPIPIFMQYFSHKLKNSLLTSGIDLNRMLELPDSSIWGSSNLQGAVQMNTASQIIKTYNRDEQPTWIANNTSESFLDHRNRIWTLTANGPCILFPDGDVQPLVPDKIMSVSGITENSSGDIILASRNGGIMVCKEESFKKFQIQRVESVPRDKTFTTLYHATDGMLYGTADLTSLDIYDPVQNYKLIESIPLDMYTYCIVQMKNDGEIWFGTNKGIQVYYMRTRKISTPSWLKSLATTTVYSIVEESPYRTWISTNSGIYALNTSEQRYIQYGIPNGSGIMNFNRNAFLKRANGEIWFGSQNGITVLYPWKLRENHLEPSMHITKMLINDVEPEKLVCEVSGASNIAEIKRLRLPYANNTLSFDFVAFDYSGPGWVSYEYKLTGIDTNWVVTGDQGKARFANLNPGEYTFRTRAMNKTSGNYSAIHSIQIVIIAPVYRKIWFIALVGLFVSAIIWWIYQMNERRKNKIRQLQFEKKLALESERLRIANDMHDDLGSGLSALSLRARFLADQIRSPELSAQVNELVGSTTRLAQQIRETIWTINSRNDTIDSLVTRLHQYALDFFEGSGIECVVELMPEQNLNPITGSIRREIYLAYKESLHNVLKHARATSVRIRLYTDEAGKLVIRIQDDGRGFDISEEHKGVGLHSMKNRMHSIGGQFILTSSPGGTIIQLIYPA